MQLRNSLRFRRPLLLCGISLFAICLVLAGSSNSHGENVSPITVRHISLTHGFDATTELLFTVVQQDDAVRWIVTEFEKQDPLRYLAQLAVNIVDYVDSDSYSIPSAVEVDDVLVDSELNVHVIKVRRDSDGSTALIGPTLLNSLGDPVTHGQPTSIGVIPQNPIDPWIAVGTDTGNIILARSGINPCVLPVGAPVIDLAVVPQVGYFAFVALVNGRDGQHLVGVRPPTEEGLEEHIVFDLVLGPAPIDNLVGIAGAPTPDDGMPLTEPAAVNLVAANRTPSIFRLMIPASPKIGGRSLIETVGDVPVAICWVEAGGSSALLPVNGSGVLYDPMFDIDQGGISRPLFTVYGNSLELRPETLQRSSDGQYITAVIESAGGRATAIQVSTITVEVNGTELKPANSFTPQLADADLDRNPDLTVKFNRKAFQARIPRGANSVLATARWTFTDGTIGFASSEIRVIE